MSDQDAPSDPPADSFARLSLSDDLPAHTQPTEQELLDALQLVFHPRQPSDDGSAANCLNALLQGPYFDEQTLLSQMGSATLDSYHLNFALDPFKLSLERVVSSPSPSRRHGPLHEQKAFLLLHHKRWLTLRRFGKHWINLSDRVPRPCQILPAHLALSLTHLEQDGCVAYLVKGELPACAGDDARLFDRHFQWNLRPVRVDDAQECDDVDVDVEGEDAEDGVRGARGVGGGAAGAAACGDEECVRVGVCVCDCEDEEEDVEDEDDELRELELQEEEAFERDLQAAIRLSLMDVRAKPLSIRRESPSTSAVSED